MCKTTIWRIVLIVAGILIVLSGCAGMKLPGIPLLDDIVENSLRNITGKTEREWTVTQLQEANAAQALFEQSEIQKTALFQYSNKDINYEAIILPPHSISTLRLKTYCMDSGDPAPKGREKMHLVPIETLLDKDILPIYKNLMQYSHRDRNHRTQIQRIVWNFRHVFEDQQTSLQLRDEDYQLLNEISPGMTLTYYELKNQLESKVQTKIEEAIQKTGIEEKARNALMEITTEVERRYGEVGRLLAQLGINEQYLRAKIEAEMKRNFSDELIKMFNHQGIQLGDSGASLAEANENVAQIMSVLESWTPGDLMTIPDDNSDYSLLKEGVGVHVSHNGGAHTTQLTIKNTTDSPVTFYPANHAVESTRKTQRLAIGGVDEMETGEASEERSPSVYNDCDKERHPNYADRNLLEGELASIGLYSVGDWNIDYANNVIMENADHIKRAAVKYGLEPAIVAGAIYAENALNVDWTDTIIEPVVVSAPIGENVPIGNLVGHYAGVSLGIGQVRLTTAMELEKEGYIYSSGLDFRERVERLMEPATNAMYVAAYLKYLSDLYPDVKDIPEVMATLYNNGPTQDENGNILPIGKPTENGGRAYGYSCFGEVAKVQYDTIKSLMGYSGGTGW